MSNKTDHSNYRVETKMDLQNTVYIVLGLIAGIMLLWFVLENTVLDRYGRYTVTPYLGKYCNWNTHLEIELRNVKNFSFLYYSNCLRFLSY